MWTIGMYETDMLSIRSIGFVTTRVFGTDDVSLGIGKWTSVLERPRTCREPVSDSQNDKVNEE